MAKLHLTLISCGIAFLCVGCTHRMADFTVISTKNIYAKGVDVTKLPQQHGVEGKDIRFLGIGMNIKDAVDRALETGGGNLMIDAALYTYRGFFVAGYKVRGTVVNVPYKKAVKEAKARPAN